jgi:hypothetical protein
VVVTEVATSSNDQPIELQALNVELGGHVFEIIGRPDIAFRVEEPVGDVDLALDVVAMRLKAPCARAGDDAVTPCADLPCANPGLSGC